MDQILDFKQVLSTFLNLTAAQLKLYQRVSSIRKMQYTVCFQIKPVMIMRNVSSHS